MYLYMVYGSETDENRHFSLFTVKSCFVMRLPLRLPGSLVVCLLEDTRTPAVLEIKPKSSYILKSVG